MKVEVTSSGITALTKHIEARRNLVANKDGALREIMRQSGAEMVKEFQDNIKRFTPGPVRDLKPATKKQKEKKHGRVYPILYASGSLHDSMSPRVELRGQVWRVAVVYKGTNPDGTPNARIASIHIKGLGHMPARDFTAISRAWRDRLFNRIRAELRRR